MPKPPILSLRASSSARSGLYSGRRGMSLVMREPEGVFEVARFPVRESISTFTHGFWYVISVRIKEIQEKFANENDYHLPKPCPNEINSQ